MRQLLINSKPLALQSWRMRDAAPVKMREGYGSAMWGDRSAGTQGKRIHANVRPRFTPIQDTMASDIGIPIITMGRDRGMADKGWRPNDF